MLAADEGPLG